MCVCGVAEHADEPDFSMHQSHDRSETFCNLLSLSLIATHALEGFGFVQSRVEEAVRAMNGFEKNSHSMPCNVVCFVMLCASMNGPTAL